MLMVWSVNCCVAYIGLFGYVTHHHHCHSHHYHLFTYMIDNMYQTKYFYIPILSLFPILYIVPDIFHNLSLNGYSFLFILHLPQLFQPFFFNHMTLYLDT